MTNRAAAGASKRTMDSLRRLLRRAVPATGAAAALLAAALLAPPPADANGPAPGDAEAAAPGSPAERPAPAAAGGPAAEAAAPEREGGSCAAALARKVQRRYEGIHDLWARFRQRSFSVALGEAGEASEARGEVRFAKPGRMRWTYESPEPSVVVSDGETLWIYDPTANEVQVMDVGRGFLSGTAIQFLLGEGDLLEAFEVAAEGCGEETVRLVLRPREEATYERLGLDVEAATGMVRATSVYDLFGNRTRVVFEEIRTDTNPAPDLFRFDPPEGTRVLELR